MLHLKHFCVTQKLFGIRTFLLVVCHQKVDKWWQFLWIWWSYFLVFSNHDFFVKLVRCLSPEWRLLYCHLVEYTTQRPNIAFEVVWLFAPYFRWGIIRSSCLSDSKWVFQVFSNIEIPNFSNSIVEKDIGRLHISVNDVGFMQFIQSFQTLVSHIPYIDLCYSSFHSNGFLYFAL